MSPLLLALAACQPGPQIPDGQLCVIEGSERACRYETTRLSWGLLTGRDVHHQVPLGTPPAEGWPVAILFQGSLHPAKDFWWARRDGAQGAWHQAALVATLLDDGYAVVTPNASQGTWWQTNVLPFSLAWQTAPDHDLMLTLFDAIDDGQLGELDGHRLFAAGISSGGYMTSRMAASYPGRFEALAIQSASWATCSGAVCLLPDDLPDDHPPTLFLHGDDDLIVPPRTMEAYADALLADGHEVEVIRAQEVGHAWLPVAPDAVVDWFDGGR